MTPGEEARPRARQEGISFLALAAPSLALIGVLDYFSDVTQSLLYGVLCIAAGYCLRPVGVGATILACMVMHITTNYDLEQLRGWGQVIEEFVMLPMVAYLGYEVRRRRDGVEASRAQIEKLHDDLKSHLELARQTQIELLGKIPQVAADFDLSVQYEVAIELGGDIFFVREVDGGLFFYLGDVSGKGPKAAIAAACVLVVLDEIVKGGSSPAQVLSELQRRFVRMLPGNLFVTSFCAVADAHLQSLVFANAGHDPPLLKRLNGCVLEELAGKSLPLGVDAAEAFPERRVAFHPGDRLLAYTDGLVDALQPGGERLGVQAVERVLADFSGNSEQLAQGLVQLAPEPRSDDVMVLVLTFRSSLAPDGPTSSP